jgi:hypothetical protein
MWHGRGYNSEQLWSCEYFEFSFDMHQIASEWVELVEQYVWSVLTLVMQTSDMEWCGKRDTVGLSCRQLCSVVAAHHRPVSTLASHT